MNIQLSINDLLGLVGLIQCVYLLVYIAFRAGQARHIIVPFLCFFVLAAAFFFDIAALHLSDFSIIPVAREFLWLSVPVFSVLLVSQVADLGALPPLKYWILLILPALSGMVALLFNDHQVMMAAGSISGCLAFLLLWGTRKSFEDLRQDKLTKGERYWLIISVIITNLFLIAANLSSLSEMLTPLGLGQVRGVLGIGMVYLASTSLLRIYPQSLKLVLKANAAPDAKISNQDKEIIAKIQNLLEMDKIYQEANFSRADLARELNISEANVSRLVSAHFGKSLPQLLNELRIRDSRQLLQQTDAAISVVAEQVGFSSLPTFNRVFKEMMNISPSEYRQKHKQ